jgi:hypothetical protein
MLSPTRIPATSPPRMKRRLVFILFSMVVVAGFLTPTLLPRAAHPGRSLGIEAYPSARDLHAFAETYRAKHQLSALGVGIIHRGKIVGLGMTGERAFRSGMFAADDE